MMGLDCIKRTHAKWRLYILVEPTRKSVIVTHSIVTLMSLTTICRAAMQITTRSVSV